MTVMTSTMEIKMRVEVVEVTESFFIRQAIALNKRRRRSRSNNNQGCFIQRCAAIVSRQLPTSSY
jgi:hypothetical protein